jgi:hypothetical protein
VGSRCAPEPTYGCRCGRTGRSDRAGQSGSRTPWGLAVSRPRVHRTRRWGGALALACGARAPRTALGFRAGGFGRRDRRGRGEWLRPPRCRVARTVARCRRPVGAQHLTSTLRPWCLAGRISSSGLRGGSGIGPGGTPPVARDPARRGRPGDPGKSALTPVDPGWCRRTAVTHGDASRCRRCRETHGFADESAQSSNLAADSHIYSRSAPPARSARRFSSALVAI